MSLLEKFRELPRAGRWGVFAGLGLAFYFIVVETAINKYNEWNNLADVRQAELNRFTSGSSELDAKITTVNNGRRVFGEASLPGPEAERIQTLQARIVAVLRQHGVREHTESARENFLSPGPLTNSLGTGIRVRRIAREVKFESTPDAMIAILSDLERAPEVSSVSRVSVRKAASNGTRNSSSRNLGVVLVVETWASTGGGA